MTDQMVIGRGEQEIFRVESNLLNRPFVICWKIVNQSTGFLKNVISIFIKMHCVIYRRPAIDFRLRITAKNIFGIGRECSNEVGFLKIFYKNLMSIKYKFTVEFSLVNVCVISPI
jgi:hypothetical protein